jgi:hypothetical protein
MILKAISLALTVGVILIATSFAGASALVQQTAQSRTIRPASVSGDLLDILNTNDDKPTTRANSGKRDYVGMSVTLDAGSLQNIIGVKQDNGPWPTHHVGAYKVEVAESLSGPWLTAFEGIGQRGESRAEFPAILGRYIRITATSNKTAYNQEWSIAELKIGVDPGQVARKIPSKTEQPPPVVPPARPLPVLRDSEKATDKSQTTRATSGSADYQGMSITIDLGGEYELSRVVQVHGQWPEEFPAEYKIEVSRERNEQKFREVWRGPGAADRSTAKFNPVVTRYIRLTALRNRDRSHWWSIAELRTNRDPEVVEDDEGDRLADRAIRNVTAQGFSDIRPVADNNNRSRATTNNVNYAGSWVLADLGGSYTVSKVIQLHDPDREDYPGLYRLETSEDGKRWTTVFEGRGEPTRSSAAFSPLRARYIRITATANHDNRHWWSIYRLRIRGEERFAFRVPRFAFWVSRFTSGLLVLCFAFFASNR